jgi:hypothetical protein
MLLYNMQYMQLSRVFARMLCSDCCPVAAVCCCNRHAKYGEAADADPAKVELARSVLVVQQQEQVDEEGDAGPPVQPVLTAAAAYNYGNMFKEFIAQHSDHFSTDEVKTMGKILDKLTAYRQQVSH